MTNPCAVSDGVPPRGTRARALSGLAQVVYLVSELSRFLYLNWHRAQEASLDPQPLLCTLSLVFWSSLTSSCVGVTPNPLTTRSLRFLDFAMGAIGGMYMVLTSDGLEHIEA